MLIPNNTPGIASFSCQVEKFKNHPFFLVGGAWGIVCILFFFVQMYSALLGNSHPPTAHRTRNSDRANI
jgi:hypothetical protein